MVYENMVTGGSLYKVVIALFFVMASEASADPVSQDIHFIGKYNFGWSGIALAKAELAIDETKENYSIHFALISSGVVNLFTRHRSDTTVSGWREGAHYLPHIYESHYWTKDKPRHLKLTFNHKGVITEQIVEPPEDPKERPDVPHALKDGALDPLTLVLAVPAGMDTPHVFDAKHLYDGKAVKAPQVALRAYDGVRNAVPYILTRTPLAGMTQKEMRQYQQGEPPLNFYVSDDERHIPLYMSMSIYLGNLRGMLIQECKMWDECKVN